MEDSVPVFDGFRLTPKRLAWLRLLASKPNSRRSRGRIGFDCMTRKFTQWCYVGDDGVLRTREEAKLHYGERYYEMCHTDGEMLTEKGRRALMEMDKRIEGTPPNRDSGARMPQERWEYHVTKLVATSPSDMNLAQDYASLLGSQGWELVSACPTSTIGTVQLWFKRRKT